MFFNGWEMLERTVLLGTLTYAGLVVLLRVSGNRTLSKMNSFDLVITIAFGSILASVLTSSSVTLAQGLLGIALLVILQFIITWLSVRSKLVNQVVKTAPTLVFHAGRFLDEALKEVRITREEVRSAVRREGYGDLEVVRAVILESDGSLSIIGQGNFDSASALEGVRGWPR